jgi:membrane-associated protein
MDPKKYFTYSAIGGIAWAAGLTILGSLLGQIEFVRKNIELMLILIVLVSVVPIIIEFVKAKREKKSLVEQEASDITQVLPPVDTSSDATQVFPRVDYDR